MSKELKSQIARMQAELEKLGVAQVNEKQKLIDLLKDEIGKRDAELEKLEEKKAEIEADKQEMQDLLSSLESSDDTQKPEDSGKESQENS